MTNNYSECLKRPLHVNLHKLSKAYTNTITFIFQCYGHPNTQNVHMYTNIIFYLAL